ncbi:hypothetical protein THRCLA_09367 [Thraustotheca clavata]|uniref:Fungal lipase-type domain-containing protein n=1 Tax=Thraustotheca clavata TaxID=74557 RepID=A0A1V9YXI1_9STRA|nr:hypothetical protein THRCLA_09367 [Thraustotheca clavata]
MQVFTRPKRPPLTVVLKGPVKAVAKFKNIANELLHLATHDKLLNPNCSWKEDLLRPPSEPIVLLEVMTKKHVVGLLTVYYFVAIILISVVALDQTTRTYTSEIFLMENDTAFIEFSPKAEQISIHILSNATAWIDAIVGNRTINGTIIVQAFENVESQMQIVNFTSIMWKYMAQDTIQSEAFRIDYGKLFRYKIDLFSVLTASVLVPSPASPVTIQLATTYTAPYMSTVVCIVLTFINISCSIYFAYRVHMFANPVLPLPQWKWIQGQLFALLCWICLPFSVTEYMSIYQCWTISYTGRQFAFWFRLIGKNGSRLAILLFCDGMATTKLNKTTRFYIKKVLAVAILTAVQGAYQILNTPSLEYPLLNLNSWLEFFVQCIMVMWLTYRRGNIVRRQPYRSASFQYITYGVISLLVVPFAFASAYTLIRQSIIAKPSNPLNGQSPYDQTSLWLGSLIRDQMFSWIVLHCYIPLPSPQSRRFSSIRRASTRISSKMNRAKYAAFCLTEAEQDSLNVFCLETAVTMLNLSVVSYYTTHLHPHSPSSCGHVGKDLPHLDVLQCEILAAFHDSETDTNALLVYEKHKERFILAFRGTGSLKNGLTDLKSRQIRLPGTDYIAQGKKTKKKAGHNQEVYVHSGFFHAYTTLIEHIHSAIDNIPEGSVLYCTGHSLGGALATIAAIDMALKHPTLNIIMYNFGSPRVGNHTFQEFFDSKISAFRIINDGDVITQYPKRDYTNVNIEGVGIFKHVGTEITLLCGGNSVRGIVVKPTVVDRVFVLAHRNNFVSHGLGSYRQSFRSLMHLDTAHFTGKRTPIPSEASIDVARRTTPTPSEAAEIAEAVNITLQIMDD